MRMLLVVENGEGPDASQSGGKRTERRRSSAFRGSPLPQL
jgi:hypothetical protein